MKFSELELDPKVLQAIIDTGYETATPIQAQAIPLALQGRDVLGIAQTGTGKTAAFTLPMITMLAKGRARARMPRSLILCPTRELAAQVSENFETYGKHHKLSMALLIGGVSFTDQLKVIDRGVDVLIATPGRLLDLFERGKLMLSGIEIMVVDEADRMLDMGFIPDIERIFNLTPFTRQTLFFSATMPPEITKLTEQFLHNPARVEVARASSTAENVTQALCEVKASRRDQAAKAKRDALRALIKVEGDALKNAIIFCNRKRDVGIVYKSLQKHGHSVGALHGDLDQRVRMQVLDGFRGNEITLLVASDVAARGLDIPAVSHVFNFDAPIHPEDYVHRIGRTGRAGRSGKAVTLATPADAKHVARVEELIKMSLERISPPGASAPQEEAEKPARSPARETDDADARPARKTRTRPEKPDAKSAPRRGREARKPAPSNRRGGGNSREDDRPVIGMGEHVPAFMLRPVPSPRRRSASSAQDDAA